MVSKKNMRKIVAGAIATVGVASLIFVGWKERERLMRIFNMYNYNPPVKELNTWSIGWNKFEPNGTSLTLYNEDKYGNETDSVVINLSDKDVLDLAKCLNMISKGE